MLGQECDLSTDSIIDRIPIDRPTRPLQEGVVSALTLTRRCMSAGMTDGDTCCVDKRSSYSRRYLLIVPAYVGARMV